jgi:elongation factor P
LGCKNRDSFFIYQVNQLFTPNFLYFLLIYFTFAIKIIRKQLVITHKNRKMINSQDVKNGTCIRLDGRLYFVIEFLHVKPGKGNTFVRTKLKDVVNGRVIDRTFQIGFKLEDVRVERRPYQFLYKEGEDFIFMNQETYDQIPIAHDLITGVDYLKEEMIVDVVTDSSTETILFAEVPTKVQLKITYTEPGLKGDTATNASKPATVETGATVRVPLFINEGETIEVDTRDGSYQGRVKA